MAFNLPQGIDPIGEKTRDVAFDTEGFFADPFYEIHSGPHSFDNLHHLHQGDGVEEVAPQDFFRSLIEIGNLRHGDGRGINGK